MPIYEYHCDACGHGLEAIQKLADPVLTVCPECAKPTLRKQISAAGFQLKGSGWYATDFRGKPAKGEKAPAATETAAAPAKATETPKSGCGSGGCGCH